MKKIARLIVRHPNPVIHGQSTNRNDEYYCKSHQHTLTPLIPVGPILLIEPNAQSNHKSRYQTANH